MKKLLAITLVLLLSLMFLVFHTLGNQLIQPYLSSYLTQYLQSELKEDIDVQIEDLKIDMDKLQCTTIINHKTKAKIKGELSLLAKKEKILHNIQIEIDQGELKELLLLAKQPPYATGQADIQLNIPTLSKKPLDSSATTAMKLHNVLLDEKLIHKEFKIEILPHTEINGTLDGSLNQNILIAKGLILSSMGNVLFKSANYNLKTKTLESDYLLTLADLSKLQPITHTKLRGEMQIEGLIKKDKNLTITGTTKDLEGEIAFTLADKQLQATFSDISVQKLMHTIYYPQIFKANVVGELHYNLAEKKGTFSSKLNQTQLLPNQLTTLIKKIQGTDLTKERYNQTTFDAKIDKENINFNFQAKSKTTTLKLHPATLNPKTNTINAHYLLDVEHKDIGGTIKGKINDPKITIDSSKFVEKEIIDKVKDYIKIDDKTLEDFGIGEKEKEAVKDLFRGFFK